MATKPIKRVFITGGHYTPAKAVIDELSDWEVFYVGRKFSMEDSQALALEYQELAKFPGIKFLEITTGRLQRRFFVNMAQSIRSLLKIPVGFVQSFWWLIRFQPNLVLSFGGYVAVPVVVCAWILDVPVLTHEQTKVVGLANRIIRLFGAKVLPFGVPLRQEILSAKPTVTNTIFVTGGNQGARAINEVVVKALPKLIKKYSVIHQTGEWDGGIKNKKYKAVKFMTAAEMAANLARAKIVISRSGANICDEIAFLGKPSIIIPLPWSGGGEQEQNALALAKSGLVEVLKQEDLDSESLLKAVSKIEDNYKSFLAAAVKARELADSTAARKIAMEVKNFHD